MISMNTSASHATTVGTSMTTPDIVQMVKDLRAEGYDCYNIARKLEIPVPEVEEIIYGPAVTDPDMIEFLHWGAHY